MKSLIICTCISIFCVFSLSVFSQSYTFDWAEPFYTTDATFESLTNVQTDIYGNTYVMANGNHLHTFMDTSYNTTWHSCSIFKISPEGNLEFAKVNDAEATALYADDNKKLYFGGWYGGSLSLPPLTLTDPSPSGSVSFWGKIDSTGHYISAINSYTGASFLNSLTGLVANDLGDVAYLENYGYFENIMDFTPELRYRIGKRNNTGFVWTKDARNTTSAMNIDELNNTYVTDYFDTAIVVNGTTYTPSGGADTYIAKLNTFGSYQWVKQLTGNSTDRIVDIESDNEGNIYVLGYSFSDSCKLAGSYICSNSGFLLKISSSGTILWSTAFNSGANIVHDLFLNDTSEYIYGLGGFNSDMMIGATSLEADPVKNDYFIARIKRSTGELMDAKQFALPFSPKIKIASPEDAVMTSAFLGTLVLGDHVLTVATGTYDYVVAKVHTCDIAVVSYADTDGDGYGNAAVNSSGCSAAMGYVLNSLDCNDGNSFIYPGAAEICNTFDDDCDALIDEDAITAVITPAGPTTFCKGGNVMLQANTGAGYTYQWLKNSMPVASATLSDYTVNKAGNYQVKITTAEGCTDTSAIEAVVLLSAPTATISAPLGTDLCGLPNVKLKANTGAGYTYQWMKGATAITGATGIVYLASAIGNYKVKVTNANGCTKISAATMVIKTCRENALYAEEISVYLYPNPASQKVYFQMDNCTAIELFTAAGQMIRSISPAAQEFDVSDLPDGIYLVKFSASEGLAYERLVISR